MSKDDQIMDDAEMITILQDIARNGKSGARLAALKELRALKEKAESAQPPETPAVKSPEDEFGGLYEVENPGRVRRAS